MQLKLKGGLGANHSAINGVLVIKDVIEHRRIGEDDEAKASGSPSGLIAHDNGLCDVAILTKVVAELVFCRVPRYSSYE